MFWHKILISLVLIASVSSKPPKSIEANGNFKLIILHNNDMHARFEQTGVTGGNCTKNDASNNKCYGGFARVAHEVRDFRMRAAAGEIPSVLYLNAGDNYKGTFWFNLYKDEIVNNFLKRLKPDAISLGDHEFDLGVGNLAKFLTEADYPVLAANLDLSNEPELRTSSNLMPSIKIEIGAAKVKVGIIGYLSPAKNKAGVVGNNVKFIDVIDSLNKEAAKLKADGVNIIIALGHSGLKRDKQIAAECPEIDLVIGGHSHSFLYTGPAPDIERPVGNYPVVVKQKGGKKVYVVQAYAYTKYLGRLNLEFDKNGDLVEIDGAPILLDGSIPQAPDVLKLLEFYRPLDSETEKQIVGSTQVCLDAFCQSHECNLGNFLTDAFVEWYAMISGRTDATIGLFPGGGFNAQNFCNKEITMKDVAGFIAYKNHMEVVEVTGKALIQALENSVSQYTDGSEHGYFLQVSGLKVVYDTTKPSGERVASVKVLSAVTQMNPLFENINETQSYKIVLEDYLANGSDGYSMFKGHSFEKFDESNIDALLYYLAKKSPISPGVEGRITI